MESRSPLEGAKAALDAEELENLQRRLQDQLRLQSLGGEQLVRRNEALEAAEDDLAARQAAVAEKEAGLAARQEDLEAAEQACQERQTALDSLAASGQKQLLQQLASREARLAELEQSLLERDRKATDREWALTSLDEAQSRAAERDRQLQERLGLLEQQQVDLAAKEASLAAMERCLAARERALGDAEMEMFEAGASNRMGLQHARMSIGGGGTADAGAGQGSLAALQPKRRLTSRKATPQAKAPMCGTPSSSPGTDAAWSPPGQHYSPGAVADRPVLDAAGSPLTRVSADEDEQATSSAGLKSVAEAEGGRKVEAAATINFSSITTPLKNMFMRRD